MIFLHGGIPCSPEEAVVYAVLGLLGLGTVQRHYIRAWWKAVLHSPMSLRVRNRIGDVMYHLTSRPQWRYRLNTLRLKLPSNPWRTPGGSHRKR